MSLRPKEAALGPEKQWAGGQTRSSHEEDSEASGSTARGQRSAPDAVCAFENLRAPSSELTAAWFLPHKLQLPVRDPLRAPLLDQSPPSSQAWPQGRG